MLGPAQRLRRSGEFATAVRCGRRAGRGALVVHLRQEGAAHPVPRDERAGRGQQAGRAVEQGSPARAGFVVSKAVGPAVIRNKVRRRLRHLVRERLSALSPGATLVVRALPSAADRSYAELAADLGAALAAARAPGKPRRRSR